MRANALFFAMLLASAPLPSFAQDNDVGDRVASGITRLPGMFALPELTTITTLEQALAILNDIADDIPDGIDWIIRVDGHTDDNPIAAGGRFADNWELSQARALSVVRFMVEDLGIPPMRLAANGFGE